MFFSQSRSSATSEPDSAIVDNQEGNETEGLETAQQEENAENITSTDEQRATASVENESSEKAGEWEVKYNQLQDQFKRLAADFENFRKRSREEQEMQARYGAQSTAQELLPVLDNLERATASLNENSEPKVLYKSFQLVYKQLTDGLANLGLQKIAVVGAEFDPQQHEAVSRMASDDVAENSIVYEAQSGYKLHDKVLRPAQVVVSTGPANSGENPFNK
jgi:molecular chaperone GrpE